MTEFALPLRVRVKPGESMQSVVLRLACLWSMPYLAFLRATRLPPTSSRLFDGIERLAVLNGTTVAALASGTPEPRDQHHIAFMGHPFQTARCVLPFRRVCPICLGGDVRGKSVTEKGHVAAYLRGTWSLPFIFGCEIHGVELLARCNRCERRFLWSQVPLDHCACGESLRDVLTRTLSDNERLVLTMMVDRLQGSFHPEEPEITQKVSLSEFVLTLRFLGATAKAGRHRKKMPFGFRDENVGPDMAAGLSILTDLPGSFETLLDTIADIPKDAQGPSSIYGPLFCSWITTDNSIRIALRPIFKAHFAKRPRKYSNSEGLTNFPVGPSSYGRQTGRLTQMEWQKLKSTLPGWRGDQSPRRCDVLAREKTEGMILSRSQAGIYLKVPSATVSKLAAKGVFKPCWADHSKQFHAYYYKADLDAWISGILEPLPEFHQKPPSMLAPSDYLANYGSSVVEHLLAFTAGTISASARLTGASGIDAILIEKSLMLKRASPVPDDAVRISALSLELNLTEATIEALQSADILPFMKWHYTVYVLQEDLQKFRLLYISLPELSQIAKRPQSELLQDAQDRELTGLLKEGVTPLYRWSEVTSKLGIFRPNIPTN